MSYKILFLAVIFLSVKTFAACDDLPSKEVDYTGCSFAENQDWGGASLVGAQMQDVNLPFTNFEKSQISKAIMTDGNFVFSNFNSTILTSSNLQYANFSHTTFENANLAKANLEGANLFMSSFKGANLYEVNLIGAHITGAVFEEANLSGVIWIDGKKCAPGSVGTCN